MWEEKAGDEENHLLVLDILSGHVSSYSRCGPSVREQNSGSSEEACR
jgi:hypothetical protein